MFGRHRLRITLSPVTTFRQNVDLFAEVYGLDTKLPELVDIKKEAKTIVSRNQQRLFLSWLNPYKDTRIDESDGALVVNERMFGHVLHPWTIVRFHLPVDKHVSTIVADESGTHLLSERSRMATIRGGSINPLRLADPGNRYRVACAVIEQFSGVHIDFREHVGRTRAITVRKHGNSWTATFDQLQPAG